MATAHKLLKRFHVCGVTCHKNGNNCNGYCTTQAITSPATYEVGLHTFSTALVELTSGKRIAREGWNGKGMWLEYIPKNGVDLPYIRLSYPVHSAAYPNGARVPWLGSQTDILADDWIVLE